MMMPTPHPPRDAHGDAPSIACSFLTPNQERNGSIPAKTHFPGLNSLRFFAALLVVIGHIPMNQGRVGIPNPHYGVAFYRAPAAVYFFFTLSGFLITYLLLDEQRRTGDIAVGKFYLRRICRIWPLYFLVVGFGLLFYNGLLPLLGIPYPVEYPILLAIGLYTFMLPNVMNSLYTVGGILNPLWSIGVEEQFYLAWAPIVKRFYRWLPLVCWSTLLFFLGVYYLNVFRWFGEGWWAYFIEQLKFHFMAAGGLVAVYLHRYPSAFLSLPFFSSRLVQLVLFGLLLDSLFVGIEPVPFIHGYLLNLLLFPWLIVTVAANPRNIVLIENRVFDYLGTISYGIYVYHMIAVYATSAFFKATSWWHDSLWLYCLTYYGMAIGLTIALAHVSYHWFELPLLRLKDYRFSVGSEMGHPSTIDANPGVAEEKIVPESAKTS